MENQNEKRETTPDNLVCENEVENKTDKDINDNINFEIIEKREHIHDVNSETFKSSSFESNTESCNSSEDNCKDKDTSNSMNKNNKMVDGDFLAKTDEISNKKKKQKNVPMNKIADSNINTKIMNPIDIIPPNYRGVLPNISNYAQLYQINIPYMNTNSFPNISLNNNSMNYNLQNCRNSSYKKYNNNKYILNKDVTNNNITPILHCPSNGVNTMDTMNTINYNKNNLSNFFDSPDRINDNNSTHMQGTLNNMYSNYNDPNMFLNNEHYIIPYKYTNYCCPTYMPPCTVVNYMNDLQNNKPYCQDTTLNDSSNRLNNNINIINSNIINSRIGKEAMGTNFVNMENNRNCDNETNTIATENCNNIGFINYEENWLYPNFNRFIFAPKLQFNKEIYQFAGMGNEPNCINRDDNNIMLEKKKEVEYNNINAPKQVNNTSSMNCGTNVENNEGMIRNIDNINTINKIPDNRLNKYNSMINYNDNIRGNNEMYNYLNNICNQNYNIRMYPINDNSQNAINNYQQNMAYYNIINSNFYTSHQKNYFYNQFMNNYPAVPLPCVDIYNAENNGYPVSQPYSYLANEPMISEKNRKKKEYKNAHKNYNDKTLPNKKNNTNNEDYLDLTSISGNVYKIAKDQAKCRTLQKILDKKNQSCIDEIYNEALEHIIELMMDPFGNYLCQKLIEVCTPEQIEKIIDKSSDELINASISVHGTRTVQKLIEMIKTPSQIRKTTNSLKNSIIILIKDINGNHVVQKCLVSLSSTHCNFIYEEILKNFVEVSTHRHGCCVIQRCIDSANEAQKELLVNKISSNCLELVQDAFGNYVVQYILNMGNEKVNFEIIEKLLKDIEKHAVQKFSSNVIEKCLTIGTTKCRKMMINGLLKKGKNILKNVILDKYGNYVIQRALSVAPEPELTKLVEGIKPYIKELRNINSGKRIAWKLAKKHPVLNIDINNNYKSANSKDNIHQMKIDNNLTQPIQEYNSESISCSENYPNNSNENYINKNYNKKKFKNKNASLNIKKQYSRHKKCIIPEHSDTSKEIDKKEDLNYYKKNILESYQNSDHTTTNCSHNDEYSIPGEHTNIFHKNEYAQSSRQKENHNSTGNISGYNTQDTDKHSVQSITQMEIQNVNHRNHIDIDDIDSRDKNNSERNRKNTNLGESNFHHYNYNEASKKKKKKKNLTIWSKK
ncbi:mRNA-binding protein PUF1, putative [Plasmodium chabaudi chabaudi]|uniref:mRNA-binding protein PUF1, putative n=1 Tax=Plasmodium chabaudi chabaudi TaxID=31271 RepID=A0A4V0KAA2_PLACU|nr:mRNA-binding protein PUF1, putative [Plasmodium chabaudi chabaudi]VTZ69812.1 mRNA-binding protein PUF1, putative [Plasmodium chabaudi chabaudi]|eukprot:XP_016654322.1 mRNA-binding protein PUF1, putative [Plasmodium chabaudi chabaudi]